MSRIAKVMQKILDLEMRTINGLDFSMVSLLPNYSDKKRGPFLVAYWRGCLGRKASYLIVQVWFYRCLGMSSVCVDGMLFTPDGKRRLEKNEMTAYY